MKGQAVIVGLFITLIAVVIVATAFMPIYRDLVANHTSDFSSSELTIFQSLGVVVIVSLLIIAIQNVTQQRRETFV